jgi:DNA modification methylase
MIHFYLDTFLYHFLSFDRKLMFIRFEKKRNRMQREREIIEVLISDLKPHPTSLRIYSSNLTSIKQLAETIRITGQLEPIIINKENIILSGVRRWKAFKHLNIPLIKAIRVLSKEEDQNIVFYNQQRKKTIREIINEAEYILGLLGKKQGVRNDLLKEQSGNIFGLIGKDRFEMAANFIGGMSASSLRRLMDVVDFEKKSEENKGLGLVEKIINKEITASRASVIIKTIIKEEKIRYNNASQEFKPINNNQFEVYNKSSNEMSEIEDNSIQVVLTSPPYFNLRNYGNGDEFNIELGHETTPEQYVENLCNHFRDVKRVLKQEGSFFLNIGETFSRGGNLLIPTRLLLSLCDLEGWYIVNEIIWKKTNALPQPVVGRLQPTYEKVFHLVKDPENYYYNDFRIYNDNEIELVRGPRDRGVERTEATERGFTISRDYQRFKDFIEEQNVLDVIVGPNAGGRQMELKRFSKVDHPALMPDYLPIIPILTTSRIGDKVLDPFSGSGTTGKTSLLLGRKYVGYELNVDNYNLSILQLNELVDHISKKEKKKG